MIEPTSAFGQLAAEFSQLPDPRYQRQPQHLLGDLLLIGLCSFLTGGRTFQDMEDYAADHEHWLRTFLELPAGPPSHDTFNRVFSALDSHAFEQALRQWAQGSHPPDWDMSIPEHPALRHLACDGKSLRGSRKPREAGEGGRGEEMARVINVWAVEQGLSIAQRRIPPEGGEIEQMPLVLRHLDLKHSVVTADAAHAQTDTVSQIVAQGGDYVICAKANQPATHAALREVLDALAQKEAPQEQQVEKGHGRLETRRVWTSTQVQALAVRGLWKNLGSIGLVELEKEELGGGKKSKQRRYFLSSLGALATPEATAQRLGALVRNHWAVENSLHWRLDVQWGEDASRARSGNAATNLSGLRKIAMNLLKTYPPPQAKGQVSMRRRMYRASINPNYLALLLKPLTSQL